MSGSATYAVYCKCGESLTVGAAAAGSEARCRCGQAVQVPRLSELRKRAGDSSGKLPAVHAINYLLLAGELPSQRTCAITGMPTSDVVYFSLWQTVLSESSVNKPWFFASAFLAGLVPALAFWTIARASDAQYVRQNVAHVPLRISAAAQARIPCFDQSVLASLLRTEPLYARLLDEHPDLTISLVETGSTCS